VFHADGQTERHMTKLRVFRNFANAPKIYPVLHLFLHFTQWFDSRHRYCHSRSLAHLYLQPLHVRAALIQRTRKERLRDRWQYSKTIRLCCEEK
jgi:hypothetical protein